MQYVVLLHAQEKICPDFASFCYLKQALQKAKQMGKSPPAPPMQFAYWETIIIQITGTLIDICFKRKTLWSDVKSI